MNLRSVKLALSALLVATACTSSQAKTAADVALTISDAVCKEEAQQPNEPTLVAIACAVEGAAGAVAHVVMPRAQWDQVRGRRPAPCTDAGPSAFDAGPGK